MFWVACLSFPLTLLFLELWNVHPCEALCSPHLGQGLFILIICLFRRTYGQPRNRTVARSQHSSCLSLILKYVGHTTISCFFVRLFLFIIVYINDQIGDLYWVDARPINRFGISFALPLNAYGRFQILSFFLTVVMASSLQAAALIHSSHVKSCAAMIHISFEVW